MTGPERHERIGELFDAALELPPNAREEFLNKACGDDAELRSAVRRLLDNHQDSGTFLHPVLERTTILDALAQPAPSTDSAGPYKVVRQLGEGGMGVVYLAHQEQPIRRDVALKVIKPGMDSGSVIARFNSERRSLALMDHPNIAQVYDAGTTSAGLPYFAMELVDGIPITQYCSEHKLDTRQKIELFLPVCHAIQHAHQKGIIHRDIKPSNVLVKTVEGKPFPKVIDFGLAKAVGSGLAENTLLTHLGTIVGTLQYMSPEQAAMNPHDVDTRSDIYSLGALLYELLTGSPPLHSEKIAKDGYLAILQKIREEEPQTPNARLRESGVTKRLDSELDWIPLKALEKERSRRYETVNGLVKDLMRYLAGEPVDAAPPSRSYKLSKFVSRNRPWIATAAVVTVLVLGGAVFSAWMAVRATRAQREAKAIADFLQYDLLSQADPLAQDTKIGKSDPQITVRTVVDRAAAKLDGRFNDQPEVEAALRETIGSVYYGLGLIQQADGYLRRAVEMRTDLHGPNAESTIEAQTLLAENLVDLGDSKGAEEILRKALDASRRTRGPDARQSLSIADRLGWVLYVLGKMDEAIPMLQSAEQAAVRTLDPKDKLISGLQRQLFVNYDAKSDFPAAERYLKKARESSLRMDSTKPAFAGDFAYLYERQGRYQEAEEEYAKALAEERRIFTAPNPGILIAMYNLAGLYTFRGRYAEAEALFRENYKLRGHLYKPDHPRTLLYMSTWAAFHTAQNKLAEADAIYAGYLPTLRQTLSDDHPTAIAGYSGLAELRVRQKRYPEAEALFSKTVESMRHTYGPENSNTLSEMASLANVRILQGRHAEAELLLRASVAGLEKAEPDGWAVFQARSLLGASLAGQRKYAEAAPLLRSGYQGLSSRRDRIEAGDQYMVAEAQRRLAELPK